MRNKNIVTAVLTICLLITGIMGNINTVQADSEPTIALNGESPNLIVKPGETTHVSFPIIAMGTIIFDPVTSIVDGNTDSPFTFSKPVLTVNGTAAAVTVNSYGTTYVDFDITVKETAVIKSYPLKLQIKGIYHGADGLTPVTTTMDFKLEVLQEKAPAQLTIGDIYYKDAIIGGETQISFLVKNEGEIAAKNAYLSMNYGDTGIVKKYTATNIKIGDLEPGEDHVITLPISILSTATAGNKTVIANFSFKNTDGAELTGTYNLYVNIEVGDESPLLDIDSIEELGKLEHGDEFVLATTLRNSGKSIADEISITVDNSSVGSASFIKNFIADGINVNPIKPDNDRKVEIPLIVSKSATDGLNSLVLNITYKDSLGVSHTKSKTIYLEVTIPEEKADNQVVIISNVKQSPAQPVAGGKIEVTFDFVNKGPKDITELKISLPELAVAHTFIPLTSDPYMFIGDVEVGATKKITIPLKVSDSIPEGLNNLAIKYNYKGSDGEVVNIPILEVQNDVGSSSIPKLIISKYVTDVAEIKAGSIFNFTFDVYNSHSSVNAKNITITVTQAENVFNVTQGSNSFFIDKIGPGETVQETLEMKVKSDTKTGSYKLHIEIEYEYDGIEPKENGEIGVTRPYDLNLQAVENARPVVDYVNVYSYDGNVTIGNTAMLSFEFYNMGKSQLSNVIATVQGDFTKADGNMYFIGNVMEGSSMYAEFEVLPNVEGMSKGELLITYEDSNGDEVQYIKEFETPVMSPEIFDPGMMDGGMDVFNPEPPAAKKEILKPWLFILIQVVIFIAFIFITRKTIITIYRNKLRKKEEEKY